jgi:hypothetical protein
METHFPTMQQAYEDLLIYWSVDQEEHEFSVLADEMDEVYGKGKHLQHLQLLARERSNLIIVDFWPPDDIIA